MLFCFEFKKCFLPHLSDSLFPVCPFRRAYSIFVIPFFPFLFLISYSLFYISFFYSRIALTITNNNIFTFLIPYTQSVNSDGLIRYSFLPFLIPYSIFVIPFFPSSFNIHYSTFAIPFFLSYSLFPIRQFRRTYSIFVTPFFPSLFLISYFLFYISFLSTNSTNNHQ